MRRRLAYAVAFGLLWTTAPANAGPYIVIVQQEGKNVIATGRGSIDVTGLSFLSVVNNAVFVSPAQVQMVTGIASSIDAYEKTSTVTLRFGNGGVTLARSGSGDNVGFCAYGGGMCWNFCAAQLCFRHGAVWQRDLRQCDPRKFRPHARDLYFDMGERPRSKFHTTYRSRRRATESVIRHAKPPRQRR